MSDLSPWSPILSAYYQGSRRSGNMSQLGGRNDHTCESHYVCGSCSRSYAVRSAGSISYRAAAPDRVRCR
jgi:hypothetical protein